MPKMWKGTQFIPEAFRKNNDGGNNIKGMEKVVETMKNDLGIAVCPICGKQFVKTKPTQKLCSAECRIESKRKSARKYARKLSNYKKRKGVEIVCENCGVVIKNADIRRKFCDECRKMKNRESQKKYYDNMMGKVKGDKPTEQKPNEQKPNIVEEKPVTIDEKKNVVEQVIKATRILQTVEEMKGEDFTHQVVKIIELL